MSRHEDDRLTLRVEAINRTQGPKQTRFACTDVNICGATPSQGCVKRAEKACSLCPPVFILRPLQVSLYVLRVAAATQKPTLPPTVHHVCRRPSSADPNLNPAVSSEEQRCLLANMHWVWMEEKPLGKVTQERNAKAERDGMQAYLQLTACFCGEASLHLLLNN